MYVIAIKDGSNNRLHYHTGNEYWKGGELLGNILEARRFETMKDVANWILNDPYASGYSLGFSVINVAEVTFNKIEEDIKNNDYELYNKFHDPLYAIR